MRRFLPIAIFLLVKAGLVGAGPLLPTTDGTSWEYQSRETSSGTIGEARSIVTVRASKELFEGKEVVKLETVSNKIVSKTELIMLDDSGIVRLARAGADGKLVNLIPAERMVVSPLRVGIHWDQEGEVAGIRMRQQWTVVEEEIVEVPAGQFQAFHLHCEDASLMSIKLDRWFAPGTGLVKDVTAVRGPGMSHRVTLELQRLNLPSAKPEPPRASPTQTPPVPPSASAPTASPEASSSPAPEASLSGTSPEATSQPNETPVQPLTVEVSSDPAGGLKTEFKTNVTNIYVRWHGHGLPPNATVRVAWVAEDVGDLVEPNFIVDETETVASVPDASARFTLSRPPDGWAEGKYRVEFYVNETLTETVRVTIGK